MIEIKIFIPLQDNDSKTFTASHHARFERTCVELVSGLTRYNDKLQGIWNDAGKQYHDNLRVYGIALDSITDGHKIGEVVRLAKEHYRQEAIFIKYLGLAEII